jgi:hypothetical protein
MGFVPLALPLAAAMVGVVLAYAAAPEWVKRVSGVQVSR